MVIQRWSVVSLDDETFIHNGSRLDVREPKSRSLRSHTLPGFPLFLQVYLRKNPENLTLFSTFSGATLVAGSQCTRPHKTTLFSCVVNVRMLTRLVPTLQDPELAIKAGLPRTCAPCNKRSKSNAAFASSCKAIWMACAMKSPR